MPPSSRRRHPSARRGRALPGSIALRDLPLDGRGPLYDQIYRALRGAILDGRVSAGTRVPPTRALARELGVSRKTVVSAFEPLRAEGYVVTRVGAGTFVAPQLETGGGSPARTAPPAAADEARPPLPLSRYGRALAERAPRRLYEVLNARPALPFDFRPCVPDLERLPDESWRRALVRTAHHLPGAAFDYADPAGAPSLREAIAAYLGRARGVRCDAEDIVIVGGVAQALDLAARLFLDEGDRVLIEDPHYLGARRTFESMRARLVAAPVDGEGLDLRAIEPSVLRSCRLAYVTPSHQFPTGAVLSLSRRQELLRWATEAGGLILEDDYDSEFRYQGRAIEALKSLDEVGRVLYVGTFSKTLLPALRIAYLVLPPALVELFRSARWLADWAAPTFEQEALARFVAHGDFERHLRRARTLYAASRAALLGAIDERLAAWRPTLCDSRAGLHVLVRFEAVGREILPDLLAQGRDRGLGLYPALPCYRGPAPEALELILGFARLGPEAIAAGIAELGRLLEELSARERGALAAGTLQGEVGCRR